MLNTRQKKILDILQEKGRVKISELASRLYVSEMTIRRDLGAMEHEGILRDIAAVRCFYPTRENCRFQDGFLPKRMKNEAYRKKRSNT